MPILEAVIYRIRLTPVQMSAKLPQHIYRLSPLVQLRPFFLSRRNNAAAPALQSAANVSTGGLSPVFGTLLAPTAFVEVAAAAFVVLVSEVRAYAALFVSVALLTIVSETDVVIFDVVTPVFFTVVVTLVVVVSLVVVVTFVVVVVGVVDVVVTGFSSTHTPEAVFSAVWVNTSFSP